MSGSGSIILEMEGVEARCDFWIFEIFEFLGLGNAISSILKLDYYFDYYNMHNSVWKQQK